MEAHRDKRMMAFHEDRKQISDKEDELLDEVEQKLNLKQHRERLFTIQWRLIENVASTEEP